MIKKIKKYKIFRKIHSLLVNVLEYLTKSINLSINNVSKNKLIRIFTFYLLKENLDIQLRVNNTNFIINSSDKVNSKKIYSNLSFPQFDELKKAKNLLQKENINIENLIDIGAHFGNISIPAVTEKYFKSAIAVEPVPENYKVLRKNIEVNNIENKVKTFNNFIGQKEAEIEIYSFKNNPAASLKIEDKSFLKKYKTTYNLKNIKKVLVKQIHIDAVLKGADFKKTIIWSYCQGDDIDIINSSKYIKSEKIPFCLPISGFMLQKNNSNLESFLNQLIESNYKKFVNLSSSNPEINTINIQNINKLLDEYGNSGSFFTLLFL